MRRGSSALAIAGSDSSGGAGLAADLATFALFDLHGALAVTAVTAQTTARVIAWEPVSTALVRAQIRAAFEDLDVVAVKIGMLGSAKVAEVVADELTRAVRSAATLPIVVDPVLAATGGAFLIEDATREVLAKRILPLATIVTPNLPELATLAGGAPGGPVPRLEDTAVLARALLARGARSVLVKGGHAETDRSPDLLVTADAVRRLDAERIPGEPVHGTGCVLSSAIAARLGLGDPLEEAVRHAKKLVARTIRDARRVGAVRIASPGAGGTSPGGE